MRTARQVICTLILAVGLAHLVILAGDRAWGEMPNTFMAYLIGAVVAWAHIRGENED